MRSTMGEGPLTITDILRRGQEYFGESVVSTFDGASGVATATFAEVGARAERLAAALRRLGIDGDQRVATFAFNNQTHLEAYLAVPAMGAVLHTLNVRLFPEQLVYVVNHAEDRVVLVDAAAAPLLARVLPELRTVEHVVVVGDGEADGLGEVLRYEELLAAEDGGFAWPDLDERRAAAMCYTSGTTGNPKGVVYSHRSTWLHAMAVNAAANVGCTEEDRALVVVPMFHANAWGMPYSAWAAGADLIFPQRFLQPEPLARLISLTRPTISAGVPTVWNDLLHYSESHELDLSSFRLLTGGGAAVPRALVDAYEDRFGIMLLQGWGMTETSPVCALSRPPRGTAPEEARAWRARTGRVVAGVQMRVVDDEGRELPKDGKALGEFEVRGPWITASYYGDEDPSRFHDGWLRTGDVGTLDEHGFMQISDRSKDVIKSGGEWISSVELENTLMANPDVVEAAVVGVPDDRWDERPLACVVLREGAAAGPSDLAAFLAGKVASWWVPERWARVEEVPKTSVGKFDKKVLRARYAKGELEVERLPGK